MREIKFRAWDIENKEMIYPLIGDLATINHKRFVIQKEDFGPFVSVELMQYTGLKDKNKIEIYEGDILSDEYYKNIKGVVHFEDGKFKCIGDDSIFDDFDDFNLEVIGNIYQNPELT